MRLPRRPGDKVELGAVPKVVLEGIGGAPKEAYKSRDYMLVFGTQQEVEELKPNEGLLNQVRKKTNNISEEFVARRRVLD